MKIEDAQLGEWVWMEKDGKSVWGSFCWCFGCDAILTFLICIYISDNQRGHVHATDGASFGSRSWAYDPQCPAGISVRPQVAIMNFYARCKGCIWFTLQFVCWWMLMDNILHPVGWLKHSVGVFAISTGAGFCPTVSAPNDMLLWIDLATDPGCQGSALILDILTHVLQLPQWLAALCWWVWDTLSEAGNQVRVASCLANMVHQQRFPGCGCMFVWTKSHHTISFNLVDCVGVLGIDAIRFELFPLRKACHCCLVAYQTESRLVSNVLSYLTSTCRCDIQLRTRRWFQFHHPHHGRGRRHSTWVTQFESIVSVSSVKKLSDILWNSDSLWKQKRKLRRWASLFQGRLHSSEL